MRWLHLGVLLMASCIIAENPGWSDPQGATTSTASASSEGTGDGTTVVGSSSGSSHTSSSDSGDSSGGPVGWWDDDWKARVYVSVDTDQLSAPVERLPVPIIIRPTTPGFAEIGFDAADLRFVDSSTGELLPVERVRWGPISGGEFWVEVPRLEPNVPAGFYLYMAGPLSESPQWSADVWRDYVGVWHFDADGAPDGSGNGRDGMYDGAAAPIDADLVGWAADIGGGPGWVHVPGDPGLELRGNVTIELWARFDALDVGASSLVAMGGASDLAESNVLYALSVDSSGTPRLEWEFGDGNEVSVAADIDHNPILFGEWSQLAVVRDMSSRIVTFYADGEPLGGPISYTDDPTNGDSTVLRLGTSTEDLSASLEGSLDEIRILSGVRTPAWIQASHGVVSGDALLWGELDLLP